MADFRFAMAPPRFCATCSRAMQTDIFTGDVVFRCLACGAQSPATPDELVVGGAEAVTETSLVARFAVLLSSAGRDPVNVRDYRDCACGENTVAVLYLGDAMQMVHACSCGRISVAGGPLLMPGESAPPAGSAPEEGAPADGPLEYGDI